MLPLPLPCSHPTGVNGRVRAKEQKAERAGSIRVESEAKQTACVGELRL